MSSSLGSGHRRAIVTVITASRREAGLTQRQLADRLPTWLRWDHSTLAKVEKGRRALKMEEFFELAKALKMDPEVLFARVARWR